MAPGSDQRIIPLAKIVRRHGVPREGRVVLKADLFAPGGEIFRGLKSVFVGPADADDRASAHHLAQAAHPENYRECALADEPAPHGGTWGRAKGVLLAFEAAQAPKAGAVVGLPRSRFPALKGEVYLCDLMGAEVVDEEGRPGGRIERYFDNRGQLSLEILEGRRRYEIPLGAADLGAFKPGAPLRVHDLNAWKDLK